MITGLVLATSGCHSMSPRSLATRWGTDERRRVGYIVRLHLTPLASRRDDQAEILQVRQTIDHGRTRQLGLTHEHAKAHGHAPVRHTLTRLDNRQVHLDGFSADSW